MRVTLSFINIISEDYMDFAKRHFSCSVERGTPFSLSIKFDFCGSISRIKLMRFKQWRIQKLCLGVQDKIDTKYFLPNF